MQTGSPAWSVPIVRVKPSSEPPPLARWSSCEVTVSVWIVWPSPPGSVGAVGVSAWHGIRSSGDALTDTVPPLPPEHRAQGHSDGCGWTESHEGVKRSEGLKVRFRSAAAPGSWRRASRAQRWTDDAALLAGSLRITCSTLLAREAAVGGRARQSARWLVKVAAAGCSAEQPAGSPVRPCGRLAYEHMFVLGKWGSGDARASGSG